MVKGGGDCELGLRTQINNLFYNFVTKCLKINIYTRKIQVHSQVFKKISEHILNDSTSMSIRKSMYDIDIHKDIESEVEKLTDEQWKVYGQLETLRNKFYNSGTAKDGNIQSQQIDQLEKRFHDLERYINQLKRHR